VRRTPSVIVALCPLMAGIWVHWSLHLVHLVGMVWLPWALAATHRLLDRPTALRTLFLAIVFGLWWLGGNPQYAYFGTLAMAAYALIRWFQVEQRLRGAVAFLAAIGVGSLLAAPVLLPSARIGETILREREPVTSMATSHVAPSELIRLVVADARGNSADGVFFRTNVEVIMDSPFFGVTALLLVGAAILGARSSARWPLLVVALVALALSVSGEPHAFLHGRLPGYDRFRVAARWVSVVPAFALPLAALGLDALVRRGRRALVGLGVACCLTAASLGAWWSWVRTQSDAPVDYLRSRGSVAAVLTVVVLLAGLLIAKWPRLGLALVAACVVAELLSNTPKWYPTTREATAYPREDVTALVSERGGRVVRAGPTPAMVSTLSSNIPMAEQIPDVQGQAVMFPKDYDRFLRLIADHGDWVQQTNVAPDLPAQVLGSPLLDVLDARTVLAESAVQAPADLRDLGLVGEPRAYANPGAEAAILVRTAVPADLEAMWSAVARSDWDPRATSAVVDLDAPVRGEGGTVRELGADVDEEAWEVRSRNGGLLRVGRRFDEGWSATIDGVPTKVLRADGIFRAVVVPGGRHDVEFRYRNPDEVLGRRAASFGLLVLATVLIATRVRTRRRRVTAEESPPLRT
jgi:hypothetical protein